MKEILEQRRNELSERYTAVARRYDTAGAKKLAELYAPNKQSTYCEHTERCVLGTAPRLARVAEDYGKEFAKSWLVTQLYDLATFCGCKGKLSAEQYKDTASMILAKYPGLKLTEIMLYFYQCKAGDFGKFYGSIDPLQIMQGLKTFATQTRGEIIDEVERRQRRRKRDEAAKRAVTYQEFLKMREK